MLLLVNRERRVQAADGAVADPGVERPRFDHEPALAVVEAELLAAEREGDGARLSRRERHPRETLEPAHGLQDARVALVDVELRDALSLPYPP